MAHIRKLATGRYQVRYRDPDKRERARNFRRRVDADRFMHEVEVRKARGSYLSPELAKTPFGEWAKQVERSRVNRRASTRIRDDALLRNHVIPRFGSRAIASIRASDIQTWISDLEERRYAPATIQKAYQILSRALRAAELDGMITRSPLLGIVLPKIEHSSMRFLDPQEVVEAGRHDRSEISGACSHRCRDRIALGRASRTRPVSPQSAPPNGDGRLHPDRGRRPGFQVGSEDRHCSKNGEPKRVLGS